MNKIWVDQWLNALALRFGRARKASWSLFAPTPGFYKRLESGDDGDLETAAIQVSKHIGLTKAPAVIYEWGLRMQPEAAGQIQFEDGLRSQVRIPMFYVGKPYELGAILAHELTHEALALQDITCPTVIELELLTDLASIALGLGKLVLNGAITELAPSTGEDQILGYLSPELRVYAYRKVNQEHRVSDLVAREHLTEDAFHMLQVFT